MKMICGKENGQSLSELENRYKAGERLPTLIQDYMEALRKANQYKESEKIFAALQLYHTEEDIHDRIRWKLFCKYQRSLDTPDARF